MRIKENLRFENKKPKHEGHDPQPLKDTRAGEQRASEHKGKTYIFRGARKA
jgi:hypothetical protein